MVLGDTLELATGLLLLLKLGGALGLGLLLAWSLGTLGNGLALGVVRSLELLAYLTLEP